MVSFEPLFLFASAALAVTIHLSTRSPGSELILSDLMALDSSVLGLKAAISNYTGGILDATPVLAGVTAVHLANRKAYTDSMLIANQSAADTEPIIEYVKNPIAIDIPETVEITKSKKPLFVASGLNDTVISALELLKSDHDSLSAALEAKLPAELHAQAAVPVKTIDDSIQSGIDYYMS